MSDIQEVRDSIISLLNDKPHEGVSPQEAGQYLSRMGLANSPGHGAQRCVPQFKTLVRQGIVYFVNDDQDEERRRYFLTDNQSGPKYLQSHRLHSAYKTQTRSAREKAKKIAGQAGRIRVITPNPEFEGVYAFRAGDVLQIVDNKDLDFIVFAPGFDLDRDLDDAILNGAILVMTDPGKILFYKDSSLSEPQSYDVTEGAIVVVYERSE